MIFETNPIDGKYVIICRHYVRAILSVRKRFSLCALLKHDFKIYAGRTKPQGYQSRHDGKARSYTRWNFQGRSVFERLSGLASFSVSSGRPEFRRFLRTQAFARPLRRGGIRTSWLVDKWHSAIRKGRHRRADGQTAQSRPILLQLRTRRRGFGVLNGYRGCDERMAEKQRRVGNCKGALRTSDKERARAIPGPQHTRGRIAGRKGVLQGTDHF